MLITFLNLFLIDRCCHIKNTFDVKDGMEFHIEIEPLKKNSETSKNSKRTKNKTI